MKSITPDGVKVPSIYEAYISDNEAALGGNVHQWRGHFRRIRILTPATAAAGVVVFADTEVPKNCKAVITSIQVWVNGATAWADASATKVGLYDTNSAPVSFFEALKAALTANTVVMPGSANTSILAGMLADAGGTVGKGLIFKADANFASGSPISVTVSGFYVKNVRK